MFGCGTESRRNTEFPPLPNARNTALSSQIQYLSDMMEQSGDKPEFLFERAKLLVQAERFTTASEDIKKAIELKPDQANYYLLQAQILRNDGDFRKALPSAMIAENMGLSDPELTFLLGELYLKNAQPKIAQTYLEEAAVNNPEYHLPHYYLAEIMIQQENATAAIAYYRKAIEANNGFAPAWQGLLNTLNQLEQFSEAAELLPLPNGLLQADHELNYWVGETLNNIGLEDSALQFFENSIEIDSNYWRSHLALGKYLIRTREKQQAAYHYEKALALQPQLPEAYYELGYLYEYSLRDYPKALATYQRAAAFDSTDAKLPWLIRRVDRKMNYVPPSLPAETDSVE